ncbi:MAG TPA: WD40 repeat domain-containing protein, partial [Aggregatilineales bacterium]|nr:WD40 repeat domain-containing protein [Aggregatilineales bacterium]
DGQMIIWNVASGEILLSIDAHSQPITSVAYSPDGGRILTVSTDGTLILWRVDTSAGFNLIPIRTLYGHSGAVRDVVFMPDGESAISGGDDGRLIRWDVRDDILNRFETPDGIVEHIAVSPDGRLLASVGQENTIRILDAVTGQEVVLLEGLIDPVVDMIFSLDSTQLAAIEAGGLFKTWNVSTGSLEAVVQSPLAPFVTSQDSLVYTRIEEPAVIRVGSVAGFHIRNIATGAELPDSILGFAYVWFFNANNAGIVPLTQDAYAAISSPLQTLLQSEAPDALSRDVSPDGRFLLTGANDTTITLWDVASGEVLRTYTGNPDWIRGVAFAPDGRSFYAASDNTITRWRLESFADGLLPWLYTYRYVEALTCQQREQYLIHPYCGEVAEVPTNIPVPTLPATATFAPTVTPTPTDT